MQTDNFEIINLNPNIMYEDTDDEEESVEDTVMELQTDDDSMQSTSNDFFDVPEILVKTRKKLNLEEYKQKRANQPAPSFNSTKNILELCKIIPDSLPAINLPSDPRAIKKFLSEVNKQENQCESVPEVEIVEEEKDLPPALHPDYEEIILMSTQCNTDISISPNEPEQSESGAKFLNNIVNNENFINSSLLVTNSLFSSINEVFQKKCGSQVASDQVNVQMEEHHGEDKVIMHLRKDRIRTYRSSASTQTDFTPLFPQLVISPALTFNRIKNVRGYRRRSSRSRSRSRSRSISPESEYYTGGYYHQFITNPFATRSHNSAYSSSMNSSELESNSDSDTSAYSSAISSDQGSTRRFENTYRHYRQQRGDITGVGGSKLQDERKIVYVGEILKETTKEDLRRKFIKYGSIKKISLHARKDGSLRYGFVTFAESSPAFEVLDKFMTDPALCNYDIRFGGRRKFCKQTYADLDNEIEVSNIGSNYTSSSSTTNNNNNIVNVKSKELSFEDLLNMAKQKLQAAKK